MTLNVSHVSANVHHFFLLVPQPTIADHCKYDVAEAGEVAEFIWINFLNI
jgi:hypothetical protein